MIPAHILSKPQYVAETARRKGLDVAQTISYDALVLSSDTIVCIVSGTSDGVDIILEKPQNDQHRALSPRSPTKKAHALTPARRRHVDETVRRKDPQRIHRRIALW